MSRLLDIFGFLAVLLRGGTLAGTSLAVGALVYAFAILRRHPDLVEEERLSSLRTCRRLVVWSTGGLVLIDLFYLFTNTAILTGTLHVGVNEIIGANFFVSAAASAAGALLLFSAALLSNRVRAWFLLIPPVLLGSLLMTSHAFARLENRGVLLGATFSHQAATAAWVGGLCALLLSLRSAGSPASQEVILRRFSRLSQLSVAVLFAAGLTLARLYVGSIGGVYGTTYGAMVVAKVLLFGLMLMLGGLNLLALRGVRPAATMVLARVQRLSEVELGIGVTIILAASSLTSQPPSVDLLAGRATAKDIGARFSPGLPRLTTPPVASLSPSTEQEFKAENQNSLNGYVPGQIYVPSNPSDIAWSEYNHNWSGIIVLAAGFFAVLSRFRATRWARHWPLAFLGLGIFLLLRSDPENWPLGPNGFWESFTVAEVAQHRLFVVLVTAFAAFEWGVQAGRLSSRAAAMVFPLVCATGGALLLTHTHALANIKEQLLIELSHIPLAIFGVIAGWARWLELRLDGPGRRVAFYVWPPSLMMVGMVLLLYREA